MTCAKLKLKHIEMQATCHFLWKIVIFNILNKFQGMINVSDPSWQRRLRELVGFLIIELSQTDKKECGKRASRVKRGRHCHNALELAGGRRGHLYMTSAEEGDDDCPKPDNVAIVTRRGGEEVQSCYFFLRHLCIAPEADKLGLPAAPLERACKYHRGNRQLIASALVYHQDAERIMIHLKRPN